MLVGLYFHKTMLLSLCFVSHYIVTLGNNFLNVLTDTVLLSLAVFILYAIFVLTCLLLLVSSIFTNIQLMLLNLNEFTDTMSVYLLFLLSVFCQLPYSSSCILYIIFAICLLYFVALLHTPFDMVQLDSYYIFFHILGSVPACHVLLWLFVLHFIFPIMSNLLLLSFIDCLAWLPWTFVLLCIL